MYFSVSAEKGHFGQWRTPQRQGAKGKLAGEEWKR